MAPRWLVLCCLLSVAASSPSFIDRLLKRHRRYADRGCHNTSIPLNGTQELEDSPYSEHYSNNANCLWDVTVPEGETILLASRDFLLEGSYNCRFDYVEVFDGEFSPDASVGRFCGRKKVRYISRSNKLYIHFRSDGSVTASGFLFTLSRVLPSAKAPCNSTLTKPPRRIQSPNYPERYPHNITCVYSFKAPKNKKVQLSFKNFTLERGPCVDDYLTVYDGKSSGSTRLGTYCGRGAPDKITSSSSSLLLEFHTNQFVRDKGFNIEYQFMEDTHDLPRIEDSKQQPEYDPDCSATITREGENVTGPVYSGEEFYLQRKRCRTVFQPPQGHGVEVRFVSFDLENSMDCIYDHLNVTYSLKEGGTTTTRLCGYQRRNSRCFHSWQGGITLDFKSDIMFQGNGYNASYRFIGQNDTSSCNESCSDCHGYCYNNGNGFHCACPPGKVPPDCVQNITWVQPLPENLTRYEGSKITLECKVNHPHAIAVWDLDGYFLPNETKPHITVKGAQVNITGAKVTDGGQYTCAVQTGDMIMSQTIRLVIKAEDEQCGQAPSQIINPNSNEHYATIRGKNTTKAPVPIPWQVLLWSRKDESHHCGGVLISERHVLTAAHCVNGGKAADFNHNNIRLSFGTTLCKKAGKEVRSVARFITHPKYKPTSLEYDFALLELDKPVLNKSDDIYPICLPSGPDVWAKVKVGYKGTISGCGKDGEKATPDSLRMGIISIAHRSQCNHTNHTNKFTEDMFCAGYEQKDVSGSCSGDSGGPFAAKVNGRWTLLGVISYGKGCSSGRYGFYGNVSYAIPWINEYAPLCGRTRFIPGNYETGRIIHGLKALPKQFPHQAALLGTKGSPRVLCGVTIIGSKWAVTAKHCFNDISKNRVKRMVVVAGDLTPTSHSETDTTGQERTIEKLYKHDSADIALLKLNTRNSLEFGEFVQPACLPGQDEDMPVGEEGDIAGWGRTDAKVPYSPSDHLLHTTMTKIDITMCEAKWKDRVSTDTICAVGRNETTQAANGDSGAGLVWTHRERKILVGVYYMGRVGTKVPGVFGDVKQFIPWIKDKMGWTEDKQ